MSTRLAAAFALMDGDSLPHLTKLTHEDGYVVSGGSDIVFKFVEIPDRPQETIPVFVLVNDEKRMTAEGNRVVVRIRASDRCPIPLNELPILRTEATPGGECLVKRDLCVNLRKAL